MNNLGAISGETILILGVIILLSYGGYKVIDKPVPKTLTNPSYEKEMAQIHQDIRSLQAKFAAQTKEVNRSHKRIDNLFTKLDKTEDLAGANAQDIINMKDRMNSLRSDVSRVPTQVKAVIQAMPLKVLVSHSPRKAVVDTIVKKTKTGYKKRTIKRSEPEENSKRKKKRKARRAYLRVDNR